MMNSYIQKIKNYLLIQGILQILIGILLNSDSLSRGAIKYILCGVLLCIGILHVIFPFFFEKKMKHGEILFLPGIVTIIICLWFLYWEQYKAYWYSYDAIIKIWIPAQAFYQLIYVVALMRDYKFKRLYLGLISVIIILSIELFFIFKRYISVDGYPLVFPILGTIDIIQYIYLRRLFKKTPDNLQHQINE